MDHGNIFKLLIVRTKTEIVDKERKRQTDKDGANINLSNLFFKLVIHTLTGFLNYLDKNR